jgi:hypothetical protein
MGENIANKTEWKQTFHSVVAPRTPVTNVSEALTASNTIALMMEAVSTYETSIKFYQTVRRNIPANNHHTRRCENPKSHSVHSVNAMNGDDRSGLYK